MFTNFENMRRHSNDSIRFFFVEKNITLIDRRRLKIFLISLLKREGKTGGNINYIFCSDEYLLNINRQYLKHDFYTDIVTFDLSASKELIDAEIYISIDRVRENAKEVGESITKELRRVMFHGLLHLCGFKDKSKKDISIMRQKENEYLERFAKL